MPREESEVPLRNLLFAFLSENLAEPVASHGQLSTSFLIKQSLGGGACMTEGALEYAAPNGHRFQHKNDILVALPNGKYIAIELKHLSAVSDQFKCRAYDMLNLKQTLGGRLRSVLVYIHMPGIGISLDQAKAISYRAALSPRCKSWATAGSNR